MLNLDLDFAYQSPKDITVVVAMSGGVDSSCVAALLHETGYNVIGITLNLYDKSSMKAVGTRTCCTISDIRDARIMATKIGFPHYVLDYEEDFKSSVIDYFVDSYAAGKTPSPCIMCNQYVKFDQLIKFAKDLGAHALVTGHYVRRIRNFDSSIELHQGIDTNKDQSYFLFSIKKEYLNFIHFPLGQFTKQQTREHAIRLGLMVASKPDSQDVCFLQNGSYVDFVSKIKPDVLQSGIIVNTDGVILGEHNGVIHYTIGQRRGLGISSERPLYVIKIDAKTNIVYVGHEEDLLCTDFLIEKCNWLCDFDLNSGTMVVDVKIRSRHIAKASFIQAQNNGNVNIHIIGDEKGITPGQACVVYEHNGTRMLGGGWII